MRRTTQACDACKLRKVRCNGEIRCQQCSHLNLRCVYSAPKPRQKSLKRGQLIAKYKQRTNGTIARAAGHEESEHSESPGSQSQSLPAISTLLAESPSSAITASSPPHDSGYFSNFLHDYEVSVYPVNPIITVAEVQSLIHQMHLNSEARAFVYAYIAVTIFLTGYTAEIPHEDTSAQVDYWCNEAARARGPMLPTDKATVPRIMTAQFLHICLMGLRMLDMAFFYLRDSITMIQMLRVDHPEVMRTLPLHERARRQRLYCEAFVHERYLAIANNRPIVLPPLQHLPELDPSLPTGIHEGFNQIISLFSLIDNDFVMNWLGSHTGSTTVTSTWVEDKQKQIDAERAGDDEGVARLTDMQQADLIITKHWLRTLVWQMAMSKCLLSSAASKESMSLLFPVRLSKQLRNLVGKMSRQAVEIHGSGIQQKLFELTDTIANVIITVPATTVEETAGRVDDFMFLFNFFFSLPRFDAMQRDILQKKLEKLQSLFPYSANTPDSTLPADDPWLSVIKTMPESTQGGMLQGDYSNHPSPQSPVNAVPQRPARMWQDMTRRLSMAPSSAPSTHAGPLGFQTR
ncbi:hypothetical protein BDV97DRAFT_374009 [Delphinella strobiligena]|nr:hypothetical protein BDV97DRAFT_374009 [Delphinella strobiligena]